METTFITIHDLTPTARVLYSSDTIVDVLGYTPDEVINRSCWDFFHPEELPYAQHLHSRGLSLDKAAVLAYCQIKDRQGQWIGCECCFTIVYDVMIVCTSIYRRGEKSQKRALEAPIVRRMFSSSPKDPRYHMLSHISAKFSQPTKAQTHEPRAALFLNRFTRTLTIMYATSGLAEIVGISGEAMKGRSFYYCIAENCLQDAVKCLENAKGNDSIAYLRFWFRDPRQDDRATTPINTDVTDQDSDEEMTQDSSDDQDEGGVHLTGSADEDLMANGNSRESSRSIRSQPLSSSNSMDVDPAPANKAWEPSSRTSSDDSTSHAQTHDAIFGHHAATNSSTSSPPASPDQDRRSSVQSNAMHDGPIELEAVISCTSDGLVVCLRRARPIIPHPTSRPGQPAYANGLFAAPWANDPVLPPIHQRPQHAWNPNPRFAPSLGPAHAGYAQTNREQAQRHNGPIQDDFMNAIRDQAIFAWALTGINGSLAEYGRGKPTGESQPPDGFPVWAPEQAQYSRNGSSGDGNGNGSSSDSRSGSGSAGGYHYSSMSPSRHIFGDPGLRRNGYRSDSGGGGAKSSGGATPFA
ncbi:hypothetical protein BJ546DRAFT_522252 [Cryomyces antarcticus]